VRARALLDIARHAADLSFAAEMDERLRRLEELAETRVGER
jgi:hypothetical protein